jgi:hypothetical protein
MVATRRSKRSLSEDSSAENLTTEEEIANIAEHARLETLHENTGEVEIIKSKSPGKNKEAEKTPNDDDQADDKDSDDSDSDKDDNAEEKIDSSGEKVDRKKRDSVKKTKDKGPRNDLTHLLPGYTATMKLNTASLDKYRPSGGLSELQRKAERTDKSTKDFVVEATSKHTSAMQNSNNGLLSTSYTSAYASFKKGTKRQPDTSAGSGWFGMKPTAMTDELKTDLAIIKNRTYLDPKRFYKSSDKFGKVLQVGTVIEGATEFYSSRLTKKQRRSNLAEEIMADPASADYTKNKFKKMQQSKWEEAKKRPNFKSKRRGKR